MLNLQQRKLQTYQVLQIVRLKKLARHFQWNKIYLNGIYNRMYQYEQEHGDLSRSDFDKLKVFFGKPDLKPTSQHKMDMARKFEEYQEFKEHMYS